MEFGESSIPSLIVGAGIGAALSTALARRASAHVPTNLKKDVTYVPNKNNVSSMSIY